MSGILVISYYFADGLGGAVRTNKFLKYWLRRRDCTVRVITAEKAGVSADHHLLGDLCGDLKVARTPWIDYLGWQMRMRRRLAWLLPSGLQYHDPSPVPTSVDTEPRPARNPGGLTRRLLRDVSDYLSVPDACWGWIPFVVWRGYRWRREYKVIYSTSPPETGHIAALWLKRWTGKPWVADFRDPWLSNAFRAVRSDALRAWNAYWEAAVIRAADRIICNTDLLREDFLARYPDQDPAKFVTVGNGFDEEDFQGLSPAPRDDRRVWILHTGSFYGLRTPVPFLSALGLLKNQGVIDAQTVCVEFLGACSATIAHVAREAVERFGLASLIKLTPPLPYRETLARQMAADLLLLVGQREEGRSMQIPGKAFEYIRTGKPILYLFPPESATTRLFERESPGQALRADPDDAGAIADALHALLRRIKQESPTICSPPSEHLRRSFQAAQVLHILKAL